MNKIKIEVFSRSGATKRQAELCLSSGIVMFEQDANGADISHITALTSQGERVVKKEVIVIPEPVKEEIKKEEIVSVVRSESPKKKKLKG